ncbi:MAG TPA: anti-sigma factor [Tepidisphaeraceae bacterium]|nr:anti-sigma factor [Tepidisphaeraceae bacterium]
MSQSQCQFLGAYFDGELNGEESRRFEQHLQECDSCRQEFRSLHKMAAIIAEHPSQDMTDSGLARLHRAISDAEVEPIWRIGVVLAVVAASILVICGAWLAELPGANPQNRAFTAPEAWEQVATSLRPDPMQLNGDLDVIRLADARVADWMLDGLSQKVSQP